MRSVHAGVVMFAILFGAACGDRREAAAVPQPQTVTLAITGMT